MQDPEGNKLRRIYRKLKENHVTEQYVKVIVRNQYRSAYTKFRCSVAPTKLETCMLVDKRLCESSNVVED